MALQLTVSNDYGVDATYWKIVRLDIDWLHNICLCEFHGWKDQASRNADNRPLDKRFYTWKDPDFTFTHTGNNTQEAYTKVKALSEWGGALDV